MEYLTASLKVLYDRVFILFNSRDIPDFVRAESEKEEKEYIDKEDIDKEDINDISNKEVIKMVQSKSPRVERRGC